MFADDSTVEDRLRSAMVADISSDRQLQIVRAILRAEREGERRWWRRPVRLPYAAAACLMVGLATAWWMQRGDSASSTGDLRVRGVESAALQRVVYRVQADPALFGLNRTPIHQRDIRRWRAGAQ